MRFDGCHSISTWLGQCLLDGGGKICTGCAVNSACNEGARVDASGTVCGDPDDCQTALSSELALDACTATDCADRHKERLTTTALGPLCAAKGQSLPAMNSC